MPAELCVPHVTLVFHRSSLSCPSDIADIVLQDLVQPGPLAAACQPCCPSRPSVRRSSTRGHLCCVPSSLQVPYCCFVICCVAAVICCVAAAEQQVTKLEFMN